jgi:hypothetical protein
MPAVRKSKSRTSTPIAHGHSSPYDTEPRKAKMQSSLDTWVEPAPQNPAASFEEHGFARHGVLETMAPLGVPPTTRVKQKVRSLGDPMAKSPALGRKAAAFGEEEASTPELTPAPDVERATFERLHDDDDDDDAIPMPFPDLDEDEDDDYMPKPGPKKKQKTSHGTKTPVRGKGTAPTKPTSTAKSPAKNGISRTPSAAPAPAATQGDTPTRTLDAALMQTIEIAVNDAHARSIRDNRPNVGIALRRMFNGGKSDATLAHALNGIIHQKESAEDWSNFRGFIKLAKKTIKREWKIQKAEEAAKAAKTHASSEFAALDGVDVSSPAAEGEGAPHPTNLEVQPAFVAPLTDSPSLDVSKSPADISDGVEIDGPTLHPLSTAPTFPSAEASSPRVPRMGSKSPRKRAANGTHARSNDVDAVSTAAPTPIPKSPAGSDSGLSEVDEEILHTGPPQSTAQASGNGTTASNKKLKNLSGRGGKKQQVSRASSEKPPAKPHRKFKQNVPRTAEQLAAEVEVENRFGDQLTGYAQVSDMRFDDDETASMTESIAAMGPPGDINRPRQTGRSARTGMSIQTSGMKRGRENSMFSSPHPDSAATSRPSTPAAVSHMSSKRVKLSHAGQASQAARTKKS